VKKISALLYRGEGPLFERPFPDLRSVPEATRYLFLEVLTHNTIDQTVKTFQTFTQALLRKMGFLRPVHNLSSTRIDKLLAPKMKQGNNIQCQLLPI